VEEEEYLDNIIELSEHSSPNPRGFDSLSLEESHYEIVEPLEPPSMDNVSKMGTSSKSRSKPEETTFL